jgi:hypothetical protein
MRIGLDFDNTIIRYDEVFVESARERGLLADDFSGTKQEVRDTIRLLPDGELKWQALQGFVYGRGITGAVPFPGLAEFMRHARRRGETLIVVSHKTVYGHFDPERVNLRDAALGWMAGQGFFDPEGLAIRRDDVHFAETRAEKLKRIAEVGCDVFIDDLEEVLDDPDFPASVRRILFAAGGHGAGNAGYEVHSDWPSIERAVLA